MPQSCMNASNEACFRIYNHYFPFDSKHTTCKDLEYEFCPVVTENKDNVCATLNKPLPVGEDLHEMVRTHLNKSHILGEEMRRKLLRKKVTSHVESYHNVLWSYLPKRTFSHKPRTGGQTGRTVTQWTDPYLHNIRSLNLFGITLEPRFIEYLKKSYSFTIYT